MKTQVLLLGTLISDETKARFLENGIAPAPADIAQTYLIRGLCDRADIESVTAICSPRIAVYPHVPVKTVKSERWTLDSCEVETVGFQNYPGINLLHRQKNIVSAAKRWAKAHRDEHALILLYSVHTPFLKAANAIKKRMPHATVAMVVADLPQFMSKGNWIKRILKKVDAHRIRALLPVVDRYILYTKYMAEHFGLREDQWMVMEGLFDASHIRDGEAEKFEERICLYAGSLDEQYAIDKLMQAFEKSAVDAKLYVYGNPDGGRRLQERFPDFKKAVYKGMLSSSDIFETMKKATLLINPRPSTLALAKYSCPSKTFEYMASGTPVLMTRLPGVPEEYDPYLYFFESEDEAGFVRTLEALLSLDDETLREKGRAASRFIRENKSCQRQVDRIIEFCS